MFTLERVPNAVTRLDDRRLPIDCGLGPTRSSPFWVPVVRVIRITSTNSDEYMFTGMLKYKPVQVGLLTVRFGSVRIRLATDRIGTLAATIRNRGYPRILGLEPNQSEPLGALACRKGRTSGHETC